MSELTKMNLIAIVQQLPDEDIEFVQQYITILEDKLQQKENIIKEVREYIKEHSTTINFKTMRADYNLNMNELLEILDKENI